MIATARKPETLGDLEQAGCQVLALDVTDEDSMQAAVAAAGPVYGLVNNAGYSQSGAIESVELDSVRRQFETNVFGLIRMSQLVLPAMREAGAGRIVNISSMGGRLTFPGGGIYHATKYAVEAISDALRFEVRGFGVDVVCIEPGLIRTEFGTAAVGSIAEGTGEGGPYGEFNAHVAEATAGVYEEGPLAKLGAGPRRRRQEDREGAERAPAAPALPGHPVGPPRDRPAPPRLRPRLGRDDAHPVSDTREYGPHGPVLRGPEGSVQWHDQAAMRRGPGR